jgi:hypothetical protein
VASTTFNSNGDAGADTLAAHVRDEAPNAVAPAITVLRLTIAMCALISPCFFVSAETTAPSVELIPQGSPTTLSRHCLRQRLSVLQYWLMVSHSGRQLKLLIRDCRYTIGKGRAAQIARIPGIVEISGAMHRGAIVPHHQITY